jgi:ribosomal protein L29
MKKKDLANLRTKTISELLKMSVERKNEADQEYAKIKAGQEKNVKKSFNLRKELAQILTILREKEITEQAKAEVKKEENKS